MNCIVIAPDNWDIAENPLQSEYSSTSSPMTWEQAEAKGLVCLPPAGRRFCDVYLGYEFGVHIVGKDGYYWSSSMYIGDNVGPGWVQSPHLPSNSAHMLNFGSDFIWLTEDYRHKGHSVRLITDVE